MAATLLSPRRIWLIGPPRVGRTTVVTRLAEVLGASGAAVRGFVGHPVRVDGRGAAVGHELVDVATGRRRLVAHRELPRTPGLGPWGVDLPALEAFLADALGRLDAPPSADLWLLDGIDRLTGLSPRFREQVAGLVARRDPLVATVPAGGGGWIRALKSAPESAVWTVTGDTRDDLPLLLHRWWRLLAADPAHL